MNLPLPLLIVAVLAWAVSAVLVWFLWKSQEPLWFKIVGTLMAAIPFFGPFLYSFVRMPPRAPAHLRATMNHHGRGGRFIGFGSNRFNYDPVVESADSEEAGGPQGNRQSRRSLTNWEKVGLIVAFIFLLIYWTKALHYLASGNAWGHSNYWGQPVGTFLLVAVLLAGSVAFIAALWRYWLSGVFDEKALGELKPLSDSTKVASRSRRKRIRR